MFNRRMHTPSRLLKLIEESIINESAKKEFRRLYVVCLCAAFESHWREYYKHTINSIDQKLLNFENHPMEMFSHSDMSNIIGKNISLGELLSCSYVFNGPMSVNKAFSDLLQKDLFKEFRETKFRMSEVPSKDNNKRPLANAVFEGRSVLKHIKTIEKCFIVRHETVHNTGVRYNLTKYELLKISSSMFTFNSVFTLFIDNKLKI